jgi:RNA polymerase sigma factor (sigma-70 family)
MASAAVTSVEKLLSNDLRADSNPSPDWAEPSDRSPESERRLLEQLKHRDESCLSEVVELYSSRLATMVASTWRGASRDDVEEVVADVVADAWFEAHSIDPHRGSLTAWLCMRARFRALDRIRAEKRRVRLWDRLRLLASSDEVEPEYPTQVDAYLVGLTEIERRLVMLRFIEGRSVSEAATICGVTTKAAERRIERLREKLRRFYEGTT